MEYEAVIGLETHVQLKTKSKMWCGCANEFGAPPNTNVCPVCLGLPGALPVLSRHSVELAIEAALDICDQYGLCLDWLYRNDRSRLPHHLAIDLAHTEVTELHH